MKKNLYAIWLGVCFVLLGMLLLYPTGIGIAAEASDQLLTSSYFLPSTDKTFVYAAYDNNTYNYTFAAKWQRDDRAVYQEDLTYSDQSTSYTRYAEADSAVVELASGFAIPQSEYSNETITSGSKVVCRVATPGTTWDNQYQSKDTYGSVYAYNSRYKYWGLETINVMGKSIQAAKITWYQQCQVIKEAPEAEWMNLANTATGTHWYAEGYGLVKSESKSWHRPNDIYKSTIVLAKVQ